MTCNYSGERGSDGTFRVWADNLPLDPRFDLRNHSPTGFNWGYNGSGPSQLSLAILADMFGPKIALEHWADFRRAFIAGIVTDEWQIPAEWIIGWMGPRIGFEQTLKARKVAQGEGGDLFS